MVKPLFDFDPGVFEVRSALEEGRTADAKRIAVDHLKVGYHSPEFLKLVAEILELKNEVGNKGKKKKYWIGWVEIGYEFQELKNAGVKIDDAYRDLAKKKYGNPPTVKYERATIAKIVAEFRDTFEADAVERAEFVNDQIVKEKKRLKEQRRSK